MGSIQSIMDEAWLDRTIVGKADPVFWKNGLGTGHLQRAMQLY